MTAPLKGAAYRGFLALLGGLSLLVGLGFLTLLGFTLVAAAYDEMIAALIFGLLYVALGACLLAASNARRGHRAGIDSSSKESSRGDADAFLSAFFEGVRQGRAVRNP
ncbi:MAG: hypothetical protein AAF618_04660 [Pseudomonadota bacterium]